MIADLNSFLKNKAIEIINKSGMDLSLIIEEIQGDLQAGYDKQTQTVSVNLRRIINNARSEQIDVGDYLEVVICHELGHAADPELTMDLLQKLGATRADIYDKFDELDDLEESNSTENIKLEILTCIQLLEELEYSAEDRACRIGRNFVSDHLLTLYDKHSGKNLQSYKENYEILKHEIK